MCANVGTQLRGQCKEGTAPIRLLKSCGHIYHAQAHPSIGSKLLSALITSRRVADSRQTHTPDAITDTPVPGCVGIDAHKNAASHRWVIVIYLSSRTGTSANLQWTVEQCERLL